MKRIAPIAAIAGLLAGLAGCDSGGGGSTASDNTTTKPNILFVVMDDVGIDQMKSFGYGGVTGPFLPNMDAVARAGVRFRNTWSMPECSPGRAAAFVGRYPYRTNVYQAIGPNDLANSQISPYDVTVPKMLVQANYESAMFGKFHLAGPENNSAGNTTPRQLGWDYFYGWIGGLPGSIDTTAGGVAPAGTFSCGFVPGRAAGGADRGACYQADGSCSNLSLSRTEREPPGLQCLDSGGIFVPNQSCGTPPSNLNFDMQNAYYVSPLVILDGDSVQEVPLTDPRSRGYRTRIETDAAIEWINSRSGNRPWMASVTYSAAHTPWQQPPSSLIPGPLNPGFDGFSCTSAVQGRLIQDRMTEAMDTEFGRLMVETGLATKDANGRLIYDPDASNTVIVIVGDNGTLGNAVKLPFSPTEAKGTAYQTGIWDPLIIAGPMVSEPDRDVEHMVNMVDVFQFFGEVAGLDAHAVVPHTLDSVGILPYLEKPGQSSLRTINFSMGGVNYQANGARNGPCAISTTCTQIPVSKSVCQDNGGIWWGPGYTDPSVVDNGGQGYSMCYEVNKALYDTGQPMLNVLPETSIAVRNDTYKLIRNIAQEYLPQTDSVQTITTEELYTVNQAAPVPLLDTPDRNLLPTTDAATQAQYTSLRTTMDSILASEPYCPGDGNMDRVVNAKDVSDWSRIATSWGLSSVYDFFVNGLLDGKTNSVDGDIIQANLGQVCPPSYGTY